MSVEYELHVEMTHTMMMVNEESKTQRLYSASMTRATAYSLTLRV